MQRRRISVGPYERLLLIKNGAFSGILIPGEYSIFATSGVSLETEKHDIRGLVFDSVWSEYLVEARPKLVRRHFVCVQTTDSQVALIYTGGSLFEVLTPAKRRLLWQGFAEIRSEIVDVIAWPAKKARKPRIDVVRWEERQAKR